jgi:hypothetical protein
MKVVAFAFNRSRIEPITALQNTRCQGIDLRGAAR